MFRKVLVACRGIPALRIVRTCRELGIRSVVPYSEADRTALPVLLADETVCIGPAPLRDSYLNVSRLLAAAEVTGCDALHPGWGFLGADPEFADATISSGIAFIGPGPDALRLFADRLAQRRLARELKIPVVPGTEEPVSSPAEAVPAVLKLGLPVVVRPVASNLHCSRLINKEKDIEYQVRMCQAEVRAHNATEQVYLERYLPRTRPVDVLVIFSQPVAEWEVGFYHREQDLLVFSPANLSGNLRSRLYRWSRLLAEQLQFQGVLVVRFLIDEDNTPYFLQLSGELSPWHPLAEIITGMDIVAGQLKVAAGENAGIVPADQGIRALAAGIRAEDPGADFEPSTGIVSELLLPGGPHLRVESYIYPGYEILGEYDLLLVNLFSWGADLETAVRRLLRGFAELNFGSIRTNIELLSTVLHHPHFGQPGRSIFF
ncbi:MAG: acetyl-CoA carboxylase biotin carboxylase subunit [candidate division WOR-3 bacterium]|uniref:biotin carboxylase n=1 Tax=candidate division WOR-3 bacterium TaxID=2052148 RepID=A0A7C3EM88_UNCW3|nr:acetyl-CoA carboxylase biotin carboxylase subunit [candidate division WOR-3 bacterium]